MGLMVIEEHLQALCANATVYGAGKVTPVPVQNIVIDPRVNFKCRVPLCKNYGRSHICPPLVMSAEEFSKVLARYSYGILVQISLPAQELGPDRERKALDQVKKLNDIIAKLERDAFLFGYRFAAGLGGGPCPLCEECSAIVGEDCRFPFQARPSMEALGIDVIKTAENAGMPIDLPPKETYLWTGLVLID